MSRNFERFNPASPGAGPAPASGLSRRTLLGGALGLGTTLLLGACRNDSSQATPPSTTPSGGKSSGAASPFPVEIAHKFGSTVVSGPSERIACVGLTEHDAVLALGMTPVAVTEWFGGFPYATWPWAQDELGDAEPTVLTYQDGVQIERVAEVAPDLILGTNAGLNKGTYTKLSAIAPTIAQSGEYTDYFEPWKVQTTAIGKALGKDEEMQALIQGVDETFASARAAHPEFEGKKFFLMHSDFYEGSIFVYQEGLSTQFLYDLGLTIPDVVEKYATDPGNANIPKEDLVDVLALADVVIWATADKGKQMLKDPIVQRLRSTREDSNIFGDLELTGAMNFTTVLSLPHVAELLVPQLAEILGR